MTNAYLDYLEFFNLRKKYKHLSQRIHSNHILKVENNINLNVISSWKYANPQVQ